MKVCKLKIFSISLAASLMVGCQSTGAQYRANSFDTSQVNTMQEAETVKIISATPANIVVDNGNNQKAAQVAGALLGAIAGALIGNGHNNDTAAIGAVAGGALGAGAGSLVSNTSTVNGVLLAYSKDNKIFTSTQIGEPCEFLVGEVSLLVKTQADETRIQPNARCIASN